MDREKDMTVATAKVFMSGRSQALRIPKAFRFDTDEVELRRTDEGILVVPKDKTAQWDWLKELVGGLDGSFFQAVEQSRGPRGRHHPGEIPVEEFNAIAENNEVGR